MSRLPLVVLASACLHSYAGAQTIWSDDFDSYPPGPLPGVNCWTCWDGTGGCGIVTDEQFFSSPHSLEVSGLVDDALVDMNSKNVNADGVYVFRAMQFVPVDFTGTTYFIMFNTWAVGGTATNNWSTQVKFEDTGEVVADFDGETLPLIHGTWVEIRNTIDFNVSPFGSQTFRYGGEVLFADTWTERVSGGGVMTLAAINLFANGATEVYYDDMSLEEIPRLGACCLIDGSCLDDASPDDCATNGGAHQGHASLCTGTFCPVCTGSCDFATADIVTFCSYPLPITVQSHAIVDDTTGEPDLSCSQFPSGNDVHEIVIEEDGVYWFSMCNAESFQNNVVYLYADCACSSLITSNFDACTAGYSEIEATLTVGTYYVSVDGFGFTEGAYVLNVFQKCILECPPGSADENEPNCGMPEMTNGGCNMSPGTELFSPLDCTSRGFVVCGTTANDGSTRDTDWYAITIPSSKALTWDVEGEVAMVSGFIQMVDGKFGSANCADGSGYVSPVATRGACTTGSTSISATTENDATYYLFVGTPFGDVVECGSLYIAMLGCFDTGPFETICPDDPNDYFKQFGGSVTGDAWDLCFNNDTHLEVLQSAQLSPLLPFIRLDYWAHSSFDGGVSSLEYHIEAHVSALVPGGQDPTTLRTHIRRYQNGSQYELIDQRATSFSSDETIIHVQDTDADDFVQAGDGEIRVRQEVFDPGITLSPNWALKVDLYEVEVSQ